MLQGRYFCDMKKLLLIVGMFMVFLGCKKPEPAAKVADDDILADYLNLPAQPFEYANQPLPDHMLLNTVKAVDNTPAHNPVTNWGATLGRVLFYDKNLSLNGTIACASCHVQENAFSDANVKSVGFEGGETKRHSMGIINARYYREGSFFWDVRAATLEDQVLMPFQDSIEMGMTLELVKERVQSKPFYPILFERAFGSSDISTERISLALSQFVRSIISYRSKYDEGRALVASQFEDFPNFTEEENRGKELFMILGDGMRCLFCHANESFNSQTIANNGLDPVVVDQGVGGITGNPNEMGLFKAPSLKSIALRAPYMHDGRFSTLMEVIEHYDTGIQPHPNLDETLKDFQTGEPKRFYLSQKDKQALFNFLLTLTDSALVTDEKFSDPFLP